MAAVVFPTAAMAAAPQRYEHGEPSNLEQLMLELVNRARANPAAEAALYKIDLNQGLAPGTISATAKPPLAFHPRLILAARNHTQWMFATNIFDHIGVNSSTPEQRMRAAGYVFSGSNSSGENIGWGGSSGPVEPVSMTAERHEKLFLSPGHRGNLCGENYEEIGLGIFQGTFQGWNALVVTQNFASSDANPDPLLLGVVFKDADGDGLYDPGEGVAGMTVTPESGAWDAVTSASGGYAIPQSGTGPLMVTFSGGGLAVPVQRSVQRTGANVKLDLIIPSSGTPPPNPLTPGLLTPEITVLQQAGPSLVTGAGNRPFGRVLRGRKSLSKTFFITNTGKATLNLDSVTRKGKHPRDFIVSPLLVSTLAPGDTTTIRVAFKPLSKGSRTANIMIQSNDADESPFNIKVSGVGVVK